MTDPNFERRLEELLASDRVSRRRFLGRTAGAGLAVGGLGAFLAACGGVEGTADDANTATVATASHPKEAIAAWTFANWPLYMEKKLLTDFDKEFGGKVKYVEEINDNYEFFSKVRQQLQNGQPIGRDIVVLTDYMAQRWVKDGYAEPIDKKNVPNAANLVENLQTIAYDPERSYTLPYQSGAVGIGYNIKKTGRELTSIDDFFDPEFKGRVTLFSEPYDAASTVLIQQGKDPEKATIDELLEAIEVISQANDDGQFRRFTGNDYTTDLTKGNAWVCMAYSGDLVQLESDNPDLRFAYPEQGAVRFTDNMMMPAKVEHPYAAETMMNYLYEPQVAAKLAAYVNYISPVDGIKEILEQTDPEIASNELIFPSDEVAANLKNYPQLTPAEERQMREAMAQVTGA
ncbi:MAG: spermidine/putrescine ABC transporter substrate-binding protein [Solirubrobacteraceae bacterium]|nr:spermidine/putrescine ABC transporter substrate-binding protein [Solirubrobacteraceae bacterium]